MDVSAGVFIAAGIVAALLGGCRQQLNRESGLYGIGPLPALQAEAERVPPPRDEPSVTNGHDRRHWPEITIALPERQVEHHPPYVCLVQLTDETARQRGEGPTLQTALEIESRSAAHAGEFFVDLAQAALLPVIIPIRTAMLAEWPWTVRRGPAPTAMARRADEADPWRWIDAPTEATAEP